MTNLLIGRELLLQYVLTSTFDMVLPIPVAYASITGWVSWKRIACPGL